MTDDENPDYLGLITSSTHRTKVILRLRETPATPSQIRDDVDLPIAHVSRALKPMREKGIVELIAGENRKKGRVYELTERGEGIAEKVAEIEGVE